MDRALTSQELRIVGVDKVILSHVQAYPDDKKTVSELIAWRLARNAMNGEQYATQTLFDRLEGKVTDKVQIEDVSGDGPMTVQAFREIIAARYQSQAALPLRDDGVTIDVEATATAPTYVRVPDKSLRAPDCTPEDAF